MASKGKKYILFKVDGSTWAMPLLKDSQFFTCTEIAPIPAVDEAVRGLTYHNGKIITVLNTAKILNLNTEEKKKTCLLFTYNNDNYGLLIDEVKDTVKATRTFSDTKKKLFKKYIRVKKNKVYILEPVLIWKVVKIYD